MKLGLLTSLGDLKTALTLLHQETQEISSRPLPKFDRLERVIVSLGQAAPKKPPLCPNEYLAQWRELLKGTRDHLEWRVVRALCWEPEAATDPRFQRYLDRFWPEIFSRPLQGLIRAYHLYWSSVLAQGEAVSHVRQRLERYSGAKFFLRRWQKKAAMLLGPEGAKQFSEEVIRQNASVKAACLDWHLDEQTNYVAIAAEEAIRRYLNVPSLNTRAHETLPALLSWEKWPPEKFKQVVGEAILHKLADNDGQFRQILIDKLLSDSRLHDPRLSTNRVRWAGVLEPAQRKFIQWLSREDIVFFFEHVLQKGRDRHRRKDFWLPYVAAMVQSRPLLDTKDEARLTSEIRKDRNFGRAQSGTSSFLLDFGSIVAVEFREAGAIYFYDASTFRAIVADFWQSGRFNVNNLKRQDKALERIKHVAGWQAKARSFLAQHGIRPI